LASQSEVVSPPNEVAAVQQSETPKKVTVCDITKDPAAYNHELLEVTAFVSRGFEDSSLYDPSCSSRFGIWVEIGGKTKTGVMYCCGVSSERDRPEEMVVEGLSVPLVDDEVFKRFDSLLERKPDSVAHATLVGRFFSGKKETFPGGEAWVGFGHMGMSSLFVIQQVTTVDPHNIEGLDYGSAMDQPDSESEGCGSYTILNDEDARSEIENQKLADAGSDSWRIDNPKRVATEGLSSITKPRVKSPIQLTETSRLPGRLIYHWRPNGKRGVRYMVVVSRPYWLSLYAKNPAKTVWVLSAAYSICD
jgi:hypothetical protein